MDEINISKSELSGIRAALDLLNRNNIYPRENYH
jgi:hypothetical protein